jgi:hypothetical protein
MSRFTDFQRIGCIACRKRGIASQADVHHLLSGGKRRGHRFTIPLCPWHHRGYTADGFDSVDMLAKYGHSLALTPRKFRDEFGSDETLLRNVDMLLGLMQ